MRSAVRAVMGFAPLACHPYERANAALIVRRETRDTQMKRRGPTYEGPSPFPEFTDVPSEKSEVRTPGLRPARFALVPRESVAAAVLGVCPCMFKPDQRGAV